MMIQILFYKETYLYDMLEVSKLRKDGTFSKCVNDDILNWINKDKHTVTILKVLDDSENKG